MADARARARHGGGATDIADDVLREALARLDGLQELVRCAATCRRWRRLVTNRAFLRRVGYWPDTARRPCVLAGIFYQNAYPGPARPPGMKKPFHLPPRFLSLQAGGGTRLTFDSLVSFDDDDALFDLARPLASRRGFLLAHVLLPGDCYHLVVCRPMVDKRSTRLLPPPPFDMTERYWHSSLTGCAILTSADADDGTDLDHKQQPAATTMFQVVLIYMNDNGFVCACTYSADTGTWSAPVQCCRASTLIRCGPRAGVVTRGGTVHWLFMDKRNLMYYALSISTVTSHVSLTEIPIKPHTRPPVPCIAGEGGRLSFVTIRDLGVAELWTKQEQYEEDEHGWACNGAWRCSKLVDLGSRRIDLVFIAETRGALLVKQGGAFSVIDLMSKERTSVHLEEDGTGGTSWFVGSCSSTYCRGHPGWMCRHTPPVLYEMDLVFSRHMPSLAFLRLGDEIRVD